MQFQIIIVILIGIIGLAGSCRREHKSRSAVEEIEQSGAVSAPIKKIVRAVADNDSAQFASLVSYPLPRPYPLHDIVNEGEMQEYYHILVDDSLRNVITRNGPENWDHTGWKGWSLDEGNGSVVWIDSLLYDVPYVSDAERQMLNDARKRDMESIEEGFRAGWEPVAALKATDGHILRIDAREGLDNTAPGNVRLLVYAPDSDLSGIPEKVMTGSLSTEGSAMSPIYGFTDSTGNSAIWEADPSDMEEAAVVFTTSAGTSIRIPASKIYWLDLIGK